MALNETHAGVLVLRYRLGRGHAEYEAGCCSEKKGGDHNWSRENPPSFPLLFFFFLFELHCHDKKAP